MKIANDREERRRQKALLRLHFPDYDARRHDAFVIRYQKEQVQKALNLYWKNREDPDLLIERGSHDNHLR